MFRIAAFGLTTGLAIAAASASPVPFSDPSLPQTTNPVVANSEFNNLMRQAMDGDASSAAELRLGDIAQFGQERNDEVARRWYSLAAAQGDGTAEEKLGDLYWQGAAGISRDRTQAVGHYKVAAGRGIASAARKVAVAYANGDGVPADDTQMLRWGRKAARAGDAEAAGMVGYAIMIGIDGSYDLVEAATLLTVASENAPSADWRNHAAAIAQEAQSKLTRPEREALIARLARWRSTLDGE
ncbi:MAG TPA: hypothetical protein DDZ81_07720 [Acetobacteraceae bacterium]|jgi:uncharacterized protein|nr:hypothetical protein [Acetobacteraceae bacterium]